MLAAVFEQLGSPLVLRSVPDPSPLADQLLLRIRACGVCGTDIHVANHARAVFGQTLASGTILGHEFSGEVVDAGSGAKGTFRTGDRVAAFPVFSCGHCDACGEGRPVNCREASFMGLSGAQGAYAEYACVPAALTFPLADTVSFANGALAEPLAVCLRAIDLAKPLADTSVLIIGAGPIGLLLSLLCTHFGARDVIVSDIVSERGTRAMQLGATGWIDATEGGVKERFRSKAGRQPAVVFDAAGGAGGLQRAMDYAGRDARIVVVAVHEDPSPVSTMTGFAKELTISFAKAYTVAEYRAALNLLADGALDVSSLITDHVSLRELPPLFQSLGRPSGKGKVIIDPFL